MFYLQLSVATSKRRRKSIIDFHKKIAELAAANGYAIKSTSTIELKRIFYATDHALDRMNELGIKIPDFNKLVLVDGNDFHSKRFEMKIKKFSLSEDKKSVNSYWTDGAFVFVCRSRKAGKFAIITVL